LPERFSVLFICSGTNYPSTRYRILHCLERFSKSNVKVRFTQPFPQKYVSYRDFKFGGQPFGLFIFLSKFLTRMYAILSSKFYDVVYIERRILPPLCPLLEDIVFFLNRNVVFDMDDAIFLHYKWEDLRNPVAKVIKRAKLTIAGNKFLRDFACKFTKKIVIIPTTVDTDFFKPDPTRPKQPVKIAWMGSKSTIPYLYQKSGILNRLCEKYKNIQLVIICEIRPNLSLFKIPTTHIKWDPATEAMHLARCHIGIMPLPDDRWSRGKCGLKLIQYMACGLASVASPYGVNSEIVIDGENGLLAHTDKEWYEKLCLLIENYELIEKMGQLARKRIEKHYSVNAVFDGLCKVLESVAKHP
jgi:glycosyltransferase involved in cell wall biosynthesis